MMPVLAQNIEFEFEKDREIKQVGNVRQVESRGAYTNRQLDLLRSEVDVLKKGIETLKKPTDASVGVAAPVADDNELSQLENSVGVLMARLDELSAATDEMTRNYNELMVSVQQLLTANIPTRLQQLEQAKAVETSAVEATIEGQETAAQT